MDTFTISASSRVMIEGQLFEPGECIGAITTTQPIDNVVSLIRFGNCEISPAKTEPKIKARANVGSTMEAESEPEPESSKLDPDALNQLDDEPEEPKKEPAKAKAAEPEKEPEVELDPSFDSLDTKWAKALTLHGLKSRDEVAKFVNEGGNLKDVDGIGNKTKTAIEAWLK
jgi:hypothetical protein